MQSSFAIRQEFNINNIQYPVLLYNESEAGGKTVILFTGAQTGMVVSSEDPLYPTGYYSTSWKMDNVHPFYGTVTLNS